MSILPILHYPDPRLFKIARSVKVIDSSILQLISDMSDTIYHTAGIGLAATQVNVDLRIIIIDISETRNQLKIFINPEIFWVSKNTKKWQEGCLSIPNFFADIIRPSEIIVQALDIHFELFKIHADGLLSVCIQHEIDHLNGKIFIEHLSALKHQRITKKLKKNRV